MHPCKPGSMRSRMQPHSYMPVYSKKLICINIYFAASCFSLLKHTTESPCCRNLPVSGTKDGAVHRHHHHLRAKVYIPSSLGLYREYACVSRGDLSTKRAQWKFET